MPEPDSLKTAMGMLALLILGLIFAALAMVGIVVIAAASGIGWVISTMPDMAETWKQHPIAVTVGYLCTIAVIVYLARRAIREIIGD